MTVKAFRHAKATDYRQSFTIRLSFKIRLLQSGSKTRDVAISSQRRGHAKHVKTFSCLCPWSHMDSSHFCDTIKWAFSTCHDRAAVLPCVKWWDLIWSLHSYVRVMIVCIEFGFSANTIFVKWISNINSTCHLQKDCFRYHFAALNIIVLFTIIAADQGTLMITKVWMAFSDIWRVFYMPITQK